MKSVSAFVLSLCLALSPAFAGGFDLSITPGSQTEQTILAYFQSDDPSFEIHGPIEVVGYSVSNRNLGSIYVNFTASSDAAEDSLFCEASLKQDRTSESWVVVSGGCHN